MSDFIAKTANIALFAVAALPFIALATARAEPVTVKISDLNMARPAQVEEFNRRVERASDRLCAGYVDPRQLTATAACSAAVHAEANAKLNQRQSALSSMTMANR